MKKLGLPIEFSNMVSMLFKEAETSIKVNNSISPPFTIQRESGKVAPLSPTFLSLWALNVMVKEGMDNMIVKGICLRCGDKQQMISQFANDSFFTLLRKEELVRP